MMKKLVFAGVALVLAVSCADDNFAVQEEMAFAGEEVTTEFYFADVDDMVSAALLADEAIDKNAPESAIRLLRVPDHRFACNGTVVYVTPNKEMSQPGRPAGTMVMEFGAGCADAAGSIRSGKVIINYEGQRFQPGSKAQVTFSSYTINGIELSGTRTLFALPESDVRMPKFRVTLEQGKALWPDGSVAIRENCFVREWIRAQSSANDVILIAPCEDQLLAVQGATRQGKSYHLILLEPLLYKRTCPIAVSGVKQYTNLNTGKVITINYGSGSCDRIVTVSADGIKRSVSISKKP